MTARLVTIPVSTYECHETMERVNGFHICPQKQDEQTDLTIRLIYSSGQPDQTFPPVWKPSCVKRDFYILHFKIYPQLHRVPTNVEILHVALMCYVIYAMVLKNKIKITRS